MQNFKRMDFGPRINGIISDSLNKATDQIHLNPYLFNMITIRQEVQGSCHADTQSIYLRGPRGFTVEQYTSHSDSVNYHMTSAVVSAAKDAAEDAMGMLGVLEQADIGHVLIVSLKPGGKVLPHVDEGDYSDHYQRFHMVLDTNPGCVMRCGEESIHMEQGAVYWFNHKKPHSFANEGDTDRLHIIFDCVPSVRVKGDDPVKLPGMVHYRESTVTEMLEVAPILFKEHWEEIAKNKQLMVLSPDEQAYRTMEEAGRLMILAAMKDDVMVGYSVSFIVRHPHYSGLTVCQNDLIYIHPDHREGGVGIRLIKKTEQEGKLRGAQLMLWHAKENTPLAAMLPRMGCGVQDIIFSKEL